jgi:hypothetical protein
MASTPLLVSLITALMACSGGSTGTNDSGTAGDSGSTGTTDSTGTTGDSGTTDTSDPTGTTGGTTGEIGSCSADLTMTFPDGTSTDLDCKGFDLDATFEFDPDDPPEIRTLDLLLLGVQDEGFECEVTLSLTGACGPLYYEVGVGFSVSAVTYDCTGVPDDYEGSYTMTEGRLQLTEVSGGTEPGNYTGDPVETRVAGNLEVKGPDLALSGDFAVVGTVTGVDSEESNCNGQADDPNDIVVLTGEGTASYDIVSADLKNQGFYDCSVSFDLANLGEVAPACSGCDITGLLAIDNASDDCGWTDGSWSSELEGKTTTNGIDLTNQIVWYKNQGQPWTQLESVWQKTWGEDQVVFRLRDDKGDYIFLEERTLRW